MKRLISIAVLALFTLAMQAQSSIDRLFDKYSGKKGFTTVTVNGNMLKFIAELDDEESDDIMDFADRFTTIRILAQDDDDMQVENFYEMVIDEINKGGYEEMVTINSDGDDVKILVKSEGKVFKEFLLVAGGSDNAIIQIKGSMTYDDVKKMSSSVKTNGGTITGFSGIDLF